MKDFANAKPGALRRSSSSTTSRSSTTTRTTSTRRPKTWDDISKSADGEGQAADTLWLVGPRREGQPDRHDLSAAAELLRRQLRQRRLVAGLRRPGRRGRARAAASASSRTCRPASAEYDTDQEAQVMLQGKCTALTEYTGLAHRVDDQRSSQVVGKIDMAATPKQEKSGPGDRHVHLPASRRAPRTRTRRCSSWSGSPPTKVQLGFARKYGSAAVTGSALTRLRRP